MKAAIDFIDQYSMPVTESGCWIWLGTMHAAGYGDIRHKREFGMTRAHRLSWAAYRGAIPEGMQVCHHCDMRACVNPDHLFLGDHQDNADDRDRKGRNYRGGKLSAEQVAEIRSSEISDKALARKFLVSPWTIKLARAGVTYAHLPKAN
jgi:hypothetical protein